MMSIHSQFLLILKGQLRKPTLVKIMDHENTLLEFKSYVTSYYITLF